MCELMFFKCMEVPLVSWEQMCIPKKLGGLNITGSKLWNMASVGKLLTALATSYEGTCVMDQVGAWSIYEKQ
uniref:Uncharacterized protein n=1 Tax=Solanum tuberosum TaxID=4113 RepID=M1AJR4_SOLTU